MVLKPNAEAMAERVRKLADDKGERGRRKKSLEAKKEHLEIVVQNLLSAVEASTEQIDALVERLATEEEELARTCADLDGLERTQFCVPTATELSQRIDEIIELLEPLDRTVQPVLQQLITPIEAFPFQQFGTEKVVLRARFGLETSGIVPPVVLASLIALRGDSVIDTTFETIPLTVDLYEPSTGPKYGLAALELKSQGLGITAIGKSLGITKRRAHIAVQYGQQLKDAGLSDPFVGLIEQPATASRWRYARRDGK